MSSVGESNVNAELSNPVFSLDSIFGVAIFDLNGLPREYFVTRDYDSTDWVQIVFQALGLKSLLMSSLKLEGFQTIFVGLGSRTALVVRGKHVYISLLLSGKCQLYSTQDTEQLGHWVRSFEQTTLRHNNRFRPV